MLFKKFVVACGLVCLAAGCSTIAEKTNMISDEKIKSESAAALGLHADELTLVSRRTEGTNTYADLKTKKGKEFTCMFNGGNLLTGGIVNPPSCAKKGEPLKTSPFGR